MKYTPVFAFALATVARANSEFYFGGYSGLMEAGPINSPALQKMDGLWFSESEDCSKVPMSAPFPQDEDDQGRFLYNLCNTNFSWPDWSAGRALRLGGDGNKCGQAITEDVSHQHFANIYDYESDPGMTFVIGECTYNTDWNQDCASDGSIMYKSLIKCTPKGGVHKRDSATRSLHGRAPDDV